MLAEKLGLKIVNAEYNNAAFGNYYTTFASNNIFIRFVNDRGEMRIELASIEDSENWYDLMFIRNFIINPRGRLNIGYNDEEIPSLIDFLEKYIGDVKSLFSRENYESFKTEIDKRLKEEFKNNFPGAIK